MADLTITKANVVPVAGNFSSTTITAGATITAGEPVYQDASDSMKGKLAQATSATAAAAVGIALNDALSGQPLEIITGGLLDVGAILTIGTTYAVSAAAAGGIAPETDLATGNYVTSLLTPISTSRARVRITVTGATHA